MSNKKESGKKGYQRLPSERVSLVHDEETGIDKEDNSALKTQKYATPKNLLAGLGLYKRNTAVS